MLSDTMREILLHALSSEHEVYPEEYARRSLNALVRKGFLEGEDDYYEITSDGVIALGIAKAPTGKRVKTIIKKVLHALYPYPIELLSHKELPSIAADEDHNTGRTAWYQFDDVICAIEYQSDELLYVIAQIACDYANEMGHGVYIETVRHLILFYREDEE
ncbi:MAG: hypothetical protein VX278_04745 [Myxococcota bacterium]|nr:hypothetical protein [Myxococcota bacterium]